MHYLAWNIIFRKHVVFEMDTMKKNHEREKYESYLHILFIIGNINLSMERKYERTFKEITDYVLNGFKNLAVLRNSFDAT